MDPRRFDNLTRTLGAGTSRRQALKALATGAAGGVAALFTRSASAAGKGGGGHVKVDCCPTTAPTLCNLTCTDTLNDINNCGSCGTPCNGTCSNGQCSTQGAANGSSCSAPSDCQSGNCVSGICCNTACSGSCISCASGTCVAANDGQTCGSATCSGTNLTTQVCANGTCASQTISCGNYLCNNGACPTSCTGDSDCASGQVCSGNQCVAACPPGQTLCSSMCVNLGSDPSHCGACNTTCSLPNATAACTSGVCKIATCNAGFADCDGISANGCEVNTNSDPNNCGACNNVCSAGQTCGKGTCQ